MNQLDTVLQLVEKVFKLEGQNKQLRDSIHNLQKMVNDTQEKAVEQIAQKHEAISRLSDEFNRENKRRIELEDELSELKGVIERYGQAIATFGIHRNDTGFWQDRDFGKH